MRFFHFLDQEEKVIKIVAEQFNKGNMQAGLALFKKNQHKFINLSDANLYLGYLAAKLKYKSIATQFFQASFTLSSSYESSIKLAEYYYLRSKYSISSYYFEQALSFRKNALDCHGLARSYHCLGLNKLAVVNFKLSHELSPGFLNNHYHARSLYNLGCYSQALSLFQTCISVNDTHWRTWQGLGRCYFKLSKYLDAISCFSKSLEYKQHWRSLKGLAWSYFYMGDYVSSQKYFMLCLSCKTDWSLFSQSSVVALGDWNKKLDSLSVIYFGLALVNAKTLGCSNTINYFEKALHNLPANEHLFRLWINCMYENIRNTS